MLWRMIDVMTLDQFYNTIKHLNLYQDLIVKLCYKYKWEKDYTFTNEYLQYIPCRDDWEWLNDWNEGQQDVKVIGFIPISNVTVPTYTTTILWKKGD